ncbi:hypothetical protein OV207_05905 [Corallococcus sp. BB11-1]|uniref:ABC-three component system middle component 5 n=1 Tax=Corallococcus sp. BB11-1 TaxID=2996783 RepID=UPI00226DED45|nr:ABC-three component system middle component 5 [Corallococcus sp. BB11-1]MCY1030982.1 hypothetical protein [Corallococcus sp. BB11-1]
MLTYHPALDPYHSAFRILRILSTIESGQLETDKIRILDFLLLFPHLLLEMRLPQKTKAQVRKLPIKPNAYSLTSSPRVVFARIATLQHQAIRILATAGLLKIEDPNHLLISKTVANSPPSLKNAVDERNRQEAGVIQTLARDIATIPLLGSDGLKARTNLMESRYDPT